MMTGTIKPVLVRIIILFFFNIFTIYGQQDSARYQISLGTWPAYIEDPFLNIEVKKFSGKKGFCQFIIEGSSDDINNKRYKSYQVAGAVGVEIYFKFLKICRLNMSAQLTGFIASQQSSTWATGKNDNFTRTRKGLFLGPEFSLEIRALRIKSSTVSAFSKLHTGHGLMYEKRKDSPGWNNNDGYYREWYGTFTTGIGYRFK